MEQEKVERSQQDQEIVFDESVCSAEFPQGCTLPVSEQSEQ